MKKYIRFVMLILSQSSHSSLSISNVPELIKYGTIAVASELIINQMQTQKLSNKELGAIFIFAAKFPLENKKPYLIFTASIYAIAIHVLPAMTFFFTHKAILQNHKNYSDFSNFANAKIETLTLQQCKTKQERIFYLAIQSIPNAYFCIDQSPIAFAHPNLSRFYTIPTTFVTNTCLLYPSMHVFLFMILKKLRTYLRNFNL